MKPGMPVRARRSALVAALTLTPAQVTGPVTPDNPITVTLTGVAPGDFVQIPFPWFFEPGADLGTDPYFLTYSGYVGEDGIFEVLAPPEWAIIVLPPNTYVVESNIFPGGNLNATPVAGPTATLTVL